MKPEWRTSTVRALCQHMLDAREFDALPILSDALQDAGCSDEDLLAQCQDPTLRPIQAERLVNLIYSEQTEAAVRWLEQFVRHINYGDDSDDEDEGGTPSDSYPHTYEYIIQVGHDGVNEGSMHFGSDEGADFFRDGDDNVRKFFHNWSLVTGVPVSDETQDGISVGCAC